jgi:hypothetical protein
MTSALPLFNVPLVKEITQLTEERAELAKRIKGLPPASHRRIALEDRLKRLTCQALQAECELTRRGER